MVKRRRRKAKKKAVRKADLDLNKDGVLDAKDKAIAGKTLATDFEDVPEPKPEGKIAMKDISSTPHPLTGEIYRKGSFVPKIVIDRWKKMGLNWQVWF